MEAAYNPGFMPGSSVSSPIELEVARIRELSKSRLHSEALTAAEALVSVAPENRDVLYLIAANLRCLNRIPEALATLEHLEQQHPRFSLLYQERGHCYVTLRDAGRAIDAFLRGVNLNPTLVTSWIMLERLYQMSGEEKNAMAAAKHVAALKYLPSDEAEPLLEAAVKIAPDSRAAHLDYARVLIDRQKYLKALEVIDTLLKLAPENTDYLSLHAAACVGLGRYEEAIEMYRRILAASPSPELQVVLGHCLKSIGLQKEAIESYRMASVLRPGFGDAYWSLANLKTYRFSQDEIAGMRAEESAPNADFVDRCHLCFALGKAYEDLNEYAEAWRFYARGNSLKRARSLYRPDITETNTRKQIEVCTPEFFAARVGVGVLDPDPIFIVGLPRSGSTLLEQILASHSQVDGAQELPDIPRIVLALQKRRSDLDDPQEPRYPDILAELAPRDFRELGEGYLAGTRAYRRNKQFFIDKMPNNFRHIGLIHLMLPNARIIDARREPMACCFSNLKQLYASGQEFSYGIEDIARYYRTYLELMRHWDKVLPGRLLRVLYEDVVEDLEKNVRRILEFCGLNFEAACVEFYKTQRSVHTASSEQVRKPIFQDALLQWRNYEAWLGPLKDSLGDALIRYREPGR
jgi:tetratricopeptide (TPR) repeat protein